MKGKKREEEEIISDQERPSEPEPTEHGPEVMQRRAEELRAIALQSKEQREQQLAAASGAADMTNPSDEMDVEMRPLNFGARICQIGCCHWEGAGLATFPTDVFAMDYKAPPKFSYGFEFTV